MGRERGSSGKALNTITLPAQTRPDVTVMADKALKTNFLPFPHNTHSYTITHFGGKSGPMYTYIPTYTKICHSQEARLVWMDLNKMSHRQKSITCHVQHVTTQVVYTHLLKTMVRAWVMAISIFQFLFFYSSFHYPPTDNICCCFLKIYDMQFLDLFTHSHHSLCANKHTNHNAYCILCCV